jgi:hypothetical protein
MSTDSLTDTARLQAERNAARRFIREGVAAGTDPQVAGIVAAIKFPGIPVAYLRGHVNLFYGVAA